MSGGGFPLGQTTEANIDVGLKSSENIGEPVFGDGELSVFVLRSCLMQ